MIRTQHKAIIQLILVVALASSLHSPAQQHSEQEEPLRLSNQAPSQGHSESEAMQELHTSGAVVCGLVVGDFEGAVNEYKKKGLILDDSIGGYLAETGGILSQVDKDDVTAKLGRLIERLRSRYSLGYTPLNGKKDGKFRHIRLKLSPEVERREGGMTIVARKGYYAAVKN